MLLDNKMGLQTSDVLKLTQLKLSTSILTGFTVTKLVWLKDCEEPTLRTQHKDEGRDEEDTCSAKELDTAPTLRPPGEPHPPPQRYFSKHYVQSRSTYISWNIRDHCCSIVCWLVNRTTKSDSTTCKSTTYLPPSPKEIFLLLPPPTN